MQDAGNCCTVPHQGVGVCARDGEEDEETRRVEGDELIGDVPVWKRERRGL